MISRMILQGLLATLLIGSLAFAWQAMAHREGVMSTLQSLTSVVFEDMAFIERDD